MSKMLLRIFAFITLLFCLTSSGFACTCGGKPAKAHDYLAVADLVFSAEVLSVRDENHDDRNVLVEFKIEKIWKGELKKIHTLRVLFNACPTLAPGKRFLIYTFEQRGSFVVSICHGTKGLEFATNDLKELGEGREP